MYGSVTTDDIQCERAPKRLQSNGKTFFKVRYPAAVRLSVHLCTYPLGCTLIAYNYILRFNFNISLG